MLKQLLFKNPKTTGIGLVGGVMLLINTVSDGIQPGEWKTIIEACAIILLGVVSKDGNVSGNGK